MLKKTNKIIVIIGSSVKFVEKNYN